MKRIGIITLTRKMTLAYAALRCQVETLGYTPVCGEQIGTDGIYFTFEEMGLVGYDFLLNFFKKAGFDGLDAVLISAPYTANWFHLPKVVACLRQLDIGPIIVGGNEPSNNYANLMRFRHAAVVNEVVDVAPDFIVRGAAETVLPRLLPLLERTTMKRSWDRNFVQQLLAIPNLVFWLPDRKALTATVFSADPPAEEDIFAFVKYGEASLAVTLQRACVWTKKSSGGCLFCAIASQFGQNFHAAVDSGFFVEKLGAYLISHPEIKYIDVWDDTFNIDPDWVARICDHFDALGRRVGRDLTYSCFLRPKGLTRSVVHRMSRSGFKIAFIGADALTEALAKRMRRGCTVAEMNASISVLREGGILPRLSVQVFSPESTIDDVGITATVALQCIQGGESTAHVHLYTFPLFGSDIYRLLAARGNLKRIPAPSLHRSGSGFTAYPVAYDYVSYDPDVERIKEKTFALLGIDVSFCVRTYPGDTVDARRLKAVLEQVRQWSIEANRRHPMKSLWFLTVLQREGGRSGLNRAALLDFLSRHAPAADVPQRLQRVYGDFGYRYTLGRGFEAVMNRLTGAGWVRNTPPDRFAITPAGAAYLQQQLAEMPQSRIQVAAYGAVPTRFRAPEG